MGSSPPRGCAIPLAPTAVQRDTVRGSLQLVSIKPKVTPILQVWVWSLESFRSTEGGWKTPTFILKTPPSSWPTSQPNQHQLTRTGNFPLSNLLIKLCSKFRRAIQRVTEAESFSTFMHLLDFQREFDIRRCVLINRNLVIVISGANYGKKNKTVDQNTQERLWKAFVTRYILCKLWTIL